LALFLSTSSSLIDGQQDDRRWQGQSNFSDGSGPLFNMYVKMKEEEDNTKAKYWQKDNDSFLIFVSSPISFHMAVPARWLT
jgi:hypothetical protein